MPNSPTQNPAFRKTQAGIKLGKILFSKNGQKNISPVQIASLLKAAGIDVPPSIQITADVAQIIMAGGMIATDVAQGARIAAYGAPTASAVQAAISILELLGLVDARSSVVQIGSYAGEAYAAFSAFGADVYADVALVLDTFNQISKSTRPRKEAWLEFFGFGIGFSAVDEFFFGKDRLPDLTAQLQNTADVLAKNSVYAEMNRIQKSQVTKSSIALLQYQAKKISVFEFMGEVAEESPEVFYNYFPDLKVFLPPHLLQISVSNEIKYEQSGGIFGLAHRNYDVKSGYLATFDTTYGYSENQIIEAIVNYFLRDTGFQNYTSSLNDQAQINLGFTNLEILKINKNLVASGQITAAERKISMGDLACLSMFPPYFDKIDSTLNLAATLNNLGLTPYDLGYEFVEDMKHNFSIFPELKNASIQKAAVSLNGVDFIFSKNQIAYNKALASKQSLVDSLVKWDISGDIGSLIKNPTGAKMISKWGDVYGLITSSTGENAKAINPPARSIKTYLSALSIMNLMSDDEFLKRDTSLYGLKSKIEMFTGLATTLDDRLREIQFLSIGRLLNLAALNNIASFFGTTADKIKMSPPESGKLAYVL